MAIKTMKFAGAFEYDAENPKEKNGIGISAQPGGNPNKKSRPGGNPNNDPEKTAEEGR